MDIQTIKNLSEITEGNIIHGVNTDGCWLFQFSLLLRKRYPAAFHKYHRLILNTPRENKPSLLGKLSIHTEDSGLKIISLISQWSKSIKHDFGPPTDYSGIILGFRKIKQMEERGLLFPPYYMPYKVFCHKEIGNWNYVKDIIKGYIPETILLKIESDIFSDE